MKRGQATTRQGPQWSFKLAAYCYRCKFWPLNWTGEAWKRLRRIVGGCYHWDRWAYRWNYLRHNQIWNTLLGLWWPIDGVHLPIVTVDCGFNIFVWTTLPAAGKYLTDESGWNYLEKRRVQSPLNCDYPDKKRVRVCRIQRPSILMEGPLMHHRKWNKTLADGWTSGQLPVLSRPSPDTTGTWRQHLRKPKSQQYPKFHPARRLSCRPCSPDTANRWPNCSRCDGTLPAPLKLLDCGNRWRCCTRWTDRNNTANNQAIGQWTSTPIPTQFIIII